MDNNSADKSIYAGLLLVALATLMLEISLTRIFSVSIGFHFAYLAVSLAMFGMTCGAMVVFLAPKSFASIDYLRKLAWSALAFAIMTVAALFFHLITPISMSSYFITSATGCFALAWNSVVIAVPFVFSGVFVSAVLTKFTNQTSSLYAADLIGASLACPLVIAVLNKTDGPSAILLTAAIATLAAVLLAVRARRSLVLWSVIACWVAILGALIFFNLQGLVNQNPPVRLVWAKGKEEGPAYNRWNSFSRVRIVGSEADTSPPFGWGLSHANPYQAPVKQMYLDIDGSAGSVLTGAGSDVRYLGYDISNMVHYLRHDANVLVVGVGGGRDVLSALLFGQKSVLGLELNNHILDALNKNFGAYSGHLDQNSRVRFVNDEARSYISRTNEKFDIIQISLIDTWAATSSGVFALAENSLYTMEAFETFLNRLNDDGILSISRWYFTGNPAEIYRLVTLSATALRHSGVQDPRAHLILIKSPPRTDNDAIGTLLISKQPFSSEDLDVIAAKAHELGFDVVLSPTADQDQQLVKIVSTPDWHRIRGDFVTKIDPPTDDSPYFFQMLRPENALRSDQWYGWNNVSSMMTMFILIFVLLLLVGICIFLPLVMRSGFTLLHGNASFFAYFACIGIGFMLMEMSMMQRLTVFLGHPIYGLSVVLFSLLVFSGLGSFACQFLDGNRLLKSVSVRMFVLTFVFVVLGIICPIVLERLQAQVTPVRITVAVALLAPLGFFAGMAFPSGFKIAVNRAPNIAPWLWAINGAASVLSASMALLISINFGTNATYFSAGICYALAGLALLKQENLPSTSSTHVSAPQAEA